MNAENKTAPFQTFGFFLIFTYFGVSAPLVFQGVHICSPHWTGPACRLPSEGESLGGAGRCLGAGLGVVRALVRSWPSTFRASPRCGPSDASHGHSAGQRPALDPANAPLQRRWEDRVCAVRRALCARSRRSANTGSPTLRKETLAEE